MLIIYINFYFLARFNTPILFVYKHGLVNFELSIGERPLSKEVGELLKVFAELIHENYLSPALQCE